MKPVTVLVGLVVLAGICSANLLQNGDFSTWDNPNQPAGWDVEDTSEASIDRSSDPVRSAPFAVKITRLVAGTGSNSGVRQYVPVSGDQPYTLSAWYYDDDINAGGGIGISWYDADTSYISHSGTVYTDSAIHSWQQLVKADTSPANAAFGKVTLRIYGFTGSPPGGIVYVDDAEFVDGVGIEELPGPAVRPGSMLAVEPNPSPGPATISLQLARAGNVCLDVYDMTGSLRANVHKGGLDAGRHELRWTGRGIEGGVLPSGLYFAVLSDTAGNLSVCKLVVRH